MPARVILVHSDKLFTDRVSTAIKNAGYSVAPFNEPTTAWHAIRYLSRAQLLITKIIFGPGQLNGTALARAAQRKNQAVRVLFIDLPGTQAPIRELGAFLPLSISITDLLDSVKFILPLAGS